jgi:hypothetical protein
MTYCCEYSCDKEFDMERSHVGDKSSVSEVSQYECF